MTRDCGMRLLLRGLFGVSHGKIVLLKCQQGQLPTPQPCASQKNCKPYQRHYPSHSQAPVIGTIRMLTKAQTNTLSTPLNTNGFSHR